MIPNNLVSEFEMLSRSNSEHQIETGGILGGIKEKGLFKITHLLLPEQKQNGSHVRGEVNDVRQISYNDLILLGLIHTHLRCPPFFQVLTCMHYGSTQEITKV